MNTELNWSGRKIQNNFIRVLQFYLIRESRRNLGSSNFLEGEAQESLEKRELHHSLIAAISLM